MVLVALAGCRASDDAGGGDSASATIVADGEELAGGAATTVAGGGELAEAEAELDAATGQAPPASSGIVAPAAPLPGQQIAIEANASVQTDDVRAAVDRLTTIVITRGGRVAAADVDYDPDPASAAPDDVDESRATLVLSVPPGELPAMADALDEVGTLTSFDQLAEDVTEQLADLDSRIANLRASVERVRALLAQAVDIDGIVRLEAELTARETELEQLLAGQRQLDNRVAMSTLTVDITTTPRVTLTAIGQITDDPGVVEALAAGWGAFTTGLFTAALVLAAIAPFLAVAAVLISLGLLVRRVVLRRRPAAGASHPV